MEGKKKLYLEANIEIHKETDALRKAVASAINLPKEGDKQPDLLYFSAMFYYTTWIIMIGVLVLTTIILFKITSKRKMEKK